MKRSERLRQDARYATAMAGMTMAAGLCLGVWGARLVAGEPGPLAACGLLVAVAGLAGLIVGLAIAAEAGRTWAHALRERDREMMRAIRPRI
jgi:hypothetical protein